MKLELKTKAMLAKDAHSFGVGNQLVRYRNTTYMPVDYETLLADPPPVSDRTIWLPLTRDEIRLEARDRYNTVFSTESELNSFDFMVGQHAEWHRKDVTTLLVKTEQGLRLLNEEGKLVDTTGDFIANALVPLLNEDKAEKERVLQVISDWVDSEEEAKSLLHHLASALAPGWSAVKYVLLIGEGRNGKSLLMEMLTALFGEKNVSHVTRQHISEQNPVVTELNGKLLNIVYDGQAVYLKDSGMEKSLIAGEAVPIRKLYESASTMVQTNALFIEGLQREPKSNDKSSALQKRIVRFQFPNVYSLDHKFRKTMLSPESLGAFLALLLDHYVHEDEVAEKLAPTEKAIALQLEHMYINSYVLQFLKHLDEHDAVGADCILGETMQMITSRFQAWRVKDGDLQTWAEPDVEAMFRPMVNTERKSMRLGGTVRKVRVVTSLKADAKGFLDSLKGDTDDGLDVEALVAD